MSIDANAIVESLTAEGSKISLTVTITDSLKAQELFGTLHGYSDANFGITVDSWGHFDLLAAYREKFAAITDMKDKHEMEMSELINRDLRSFLQE